MPAYGLHHAQDDEDRVEDGQAREHSVENAFQVFAEEESFINSNVSWWRSFSRFFSSVAIMSIDLLGKFNNDGNLSWGKVSKSYSQGEVVFQSRIRWKRSVAIFCLLYELLLESSFWKPKKGTSVFESYLHKIGMATRLARTPRMPMAVCTTISIQYVSSA